MLNCPKCQTGTLVVDSRPTDNGSVMRRRRKCPQCQHLFTTYEMNADVSPIKHQAWIIQVKTALAELQQKVEKADQAINQP